MNTLKGAVLRLCGEVPQRPLQISESRIVETSVVEVEKEMTTFRTGELVRTTGNWEGWITLGIAYSYEDWLALTNEEDTNQNRRYVYVKAIKGTLLDLHPKEAEDIGGYYPMHIEKLTNME